MVCQAALPRFYPRNLPKPKSRTGNRSVLSQEPPRGSLRPTRTPRPTQSPLRPLTPALPGRDPRHRPGQREDLGRTHPRSQLKRPPNPSSCPLVVRHNAIRAGRLATRQLTSQARLWPLARPAPNAKVSRPLPAPIGLILAPPTEPGRGGAGADSGGAASPRLIGGQPTTLAAADRANLPNNLRTHCDARVFLRGATPSSNIRSTNPSPPGSRQAAHSICCVLHRPHPVCVHRPSAGRGPLTYNLST